MTIELRHLRYFVAVAEEASFTAAAQRVHVAQQVLSTQIRQLEDSVGAQLLNRTSKGATLTPAGAAFLTSARDTLAGLDRAVASARNAARAACVRPPRRGSMPVLVSASSRARRCRPPRCALPAGSATPGPRCGISSH
jgi:DNA-binding transcriptional LysR family regulator